MRFLRQAVRVAQEVGAGLERRQVLLRPLPWPENFEVGAAVTDASRPHGSRGWRCVGCVARLASQARLTQGF